jgi:hypothetical protein
MDGEIILTPKDLLQGIINSAEDIRLRSNDSTVYTLAGSIQSNAEDLLKNPLIDQGLI